MATRFTDSAKTAEVVQRMITTDQTVGGVNRSLINRLFNSDPPYTESEAREAGVELNLNLGEATAYALDARRQWHNAFVKPLPAFRIRLDSGPVDQRSIMGDKLTALINKPISKKREFFETRRAVSSNVVLHGKGPSIWEKRYQWWCRPLSLASLLIPDRTSILFTDLPFFAIKRYWSPWELWDMKESLKGFNSELVNKIIRGMENLDSGKKPFWKDGKTPGVPDASDPEEAAEDIRSNGGYYDSDVWRKVEVWDFYFRDYKNENWYRRMIWPTDTSSWLYDGGSSIVANAVDQIIHVHYADGAHTAPARYHSVRGLGYLLYAAAHLMNRFRCRSFEHAFTALMMWLRNIGVGDREALMDIVFKNLCVVPRGVDLVPANERYTADWRTIDWATTQLKALMAEHANPYTQDLDPESKPYEKATRTMLRSQQMGQLLSGMLELGYEYETYRYREICRRFCLKASPDPDVKQFREEASREGIPDKLLDSDRWEITPEKVLGGGSKAMETMAAQQLIGAIGLFDARAQQTIKRLFVTALHGPDLALELAPPEPREPSVTQQRAQSDFAILMTGIELADVRPPNLAEYVLQLAAGLDQKMQQASTLPNGPSPEEVIGLINVLRVLTMRLQELAGDKANQAQWQQIGQVIEQYRQQVMQWAQALSSQPNVDPQVLAKIQESQAMAQQKISERQQASDQRREQRYMDNLAEQRRKDEANAAEIERKQLLAANEAAIAQRTVPKRQTGS